MGSNNSIIMQEAINHGLLTETEAELKLIQGETPDLHTYSGWLERGYHVKAGERAIIKTKLWIKDPTEKFHLVPTGLFSIEQVENIIEEEGL